MNHGKDSLAPRCHRPVHHPGLAGVVVRGGCRSPHQVGVLIVTEDDDLEIDKTKVDLLFDGIALFNAVAIIALVCVIAGGWLK